MKIKTTLVIILSMMLVIDLIAFPFLFENGSLFNAGLKVYKYLLSAGIVMIFWVYFVINFIPKVENSISYKIAFLPIQERNKESFDFHYKTVFKIVSFLISAIILFIFFLSVKNFNLVMNEIALFLQLNSLPK